MAPKQCVQVEEKVWGRLPSWEIREFDSEKDYNTAYEEEEDEIADNLFEMQNAFFLENPEDWRV